MNYNLNTVNEPEKSYKISHNYPIKFREVLEIYLDELTLKNRATNTINSYYSDLKIFFDYITEKFKDIQEISELKVYHLTKFYSYLQKDRKNGFISISRKKVVLEQFFAFSVQQGYMNEGKSPIPKEDIVKSMKKENNKKPIYLEMEEVKKLFNNILECENEFNKYRDITIFALLFKTGLRVSELRDLNLIDIENAKKYGILIITGKGEKERRIAIKKSDFEEGYLSYLNKYLNLRRQIDIEGEFKDALFISRVQKSRLTNRQIQRLVKKYKELAGIEKEITPHKFRHSFATHLLRAGAPLRVVQQLLGHESLATTQIYTHLIDDDIRDTIQKYSPRI